MPNGCVGFPGTRETHCQAQSCRSLSNITCPGPRTFGIKQFVQCRIAGGLKVNATCMYKYKAGEIAALWRAALAVLQHRDPASTRGVPDVRIPHTCFGDRLEG